MVVKQLFILLVALFLVFDALAQPISTDQLPKNVSRGFKAKYAGIESIIWTKGETRVYEADFESGRTNYTATFSEEGKWIQTENELEIDSLPPNIKSTLDKQFEGYTIVDAELIDSAEKGRFYTAHLERGEEMLLVTMNEEGKVTKRETDDDEG